MAHLGTQSTQAPLSLGTIGIYLTLPVTHSTFTCVLCWAVSIRTSCRDSDTALLGSGDTSKSFWTRAANIFAGYLAQGVRSTGPFLLAGVDTLEADADLIRRAVLVVPAAEGADTVAADLGAGALLAGDAGDHAHAVAALLPYQAVILTPTGIPTLSSLTG